MDTRQSICLIFLHDAGNGCCLMMKGNDMKTNRCVIIGASPDSKTDDLKRLITSDDFVICADEGYLKAKQADITPHLLIGDFDSSMYPDDCECDIIQLPVQKDDTDTMVCVREGLKRGYRDFLLLGMTGGRADHTFANYSTLLFLAKHGAKGEIADGDWRYRVLLNDVCRITDCKGYHFGIFPFGCESCRVSLKGFLYEGENILLKAEFPMGVSNTISSMEAEVKTEDCVLMMYGKTS